MFRYKLECCDNGKTMSGVQYVGAMTPEQESRYVIFGGDENLNNVSVTLDSMIKFRYQLDHKNSSLISLYNVCNCL